MKAFFYTLVMLCLIVTVSCKQPTTPKPRGYFRIDFPEKEFRVYDSICPFTFEYPVYGQVEAVAGAYSEPCWFNINFAEHNAKIHLTYKELNNNLALHVEDMRTLVYKHIVKADDIVEHIVIGHESQVYGIIYELKGNTASSATFFVTDSVHHFLSGSLYFSSLPNKDSLAPSIQFFQEDIVHLTKTIAWR